MRFARREQKGGTHLATANCSPRPKRPGLPKKDVHRIFVEERHLIDEALARAVRDAVLRHKELGLPVVVERDGKIEWVKPEDLGF